MDNRRTRLGGGPIRSQEDKDLVAEVKRLKEILKRIKAEADEGFTVEGDDAE